MADADRARAEPSDVLSRITFILRQPVDFTHTDTTSRLAQVRLLVAAATYFNILTVTDYGGRVGPVREGGLVELAVAAAFQTFEGTDPHPGPFDKAAMLLRGITRGHPFNDGNKRTGFLLAAYYLRLVGYPFPERLPTDEVVDLCLRVSAGHLSDVETVAGELRRIWGKRRPELSP